MRKTIRLSGLLLLLVVVFAFSRSDIPEVVNTYEPAGEAVPLNFRLHKFNANGVELALNGPHLPTFFIQFDVAMEGMHPVVTMAGLSNRSRLRGTAALRNLPDFPFLRNKDGTPVTSFTFENQIGDDGEGNQALCMTYTGVPVPLVETLVIGRSLTLPEAVSRHLGVEGQVEFQPGRLYLDKDLGGFCVPINMEHDGDEYE